MKDFQDARHGDLDEAGRRDADELVLAPFFTGVVVGVVAGLVIIFLLANA